MAAVAKWLERQTADAEVPGSSPHHGKEELSRSSLTTASPHPGVMGTWPVMVLVRVLKPVFKAEDSPGTISHIHLSHIHLNIMASCVT